VRSLVTQLMRNGAESIFCDIKRQSHRWARNLPGVTYCREIAEIHNALVATGIEGDRRNRLTDDIADEVDTENLDVGSRIVLVLEEMNATIGKLQTYWEEIRTKDDPKRSPAIAALGEILFMGRAVKINVIAVGQLLTARALGGPEMRECFGCRILARASNNAWKMLAPEIQPIPKKTRHVGRMHVVIGGEAYETQGLFFTDKEAQDWARAGKVSVPSSWSNATESDMVGRTPIETPLTLSEIASQRVVPITYSTLRTHKSKDSTFPSPIGRKGESDTYRIIDILSWWEHKNARKDKGVKA
jgi:hypothetical protein